MDSEMRIFIIEDDDSLRYECARLLKLADYQPLTCNNFACAAEEALASDAACVILDLKLPDADGLAICRALREASEVPIVVLTSSESEFDEVMSMDLGADDYIVKPYSPAVLLARVRSAIRRANPERTCTVEWRGLTLDAARSRVSYQGTSAELSRNEIRILSSLMRAKGAIVPRSELMYELWQSDEFVDDNTLTVNVNRLRASLSALGAPRTLLTTHRGQGYAL